MTETKTCCACGAERPVADFSKNRSRKDGRDQRCKECVAAYHRAYYAKNREAILAQSAAWQKANPEKARAKSLRYLANSPEKRAAVTARSKEKNPHADAEKSARYRSKNLEARREQDRMRSINDPEKERARHKKYRLSNLSRDCAKVARRNASKLDATPPWLTKEHHAHIEKVYAISAFLTERTGAAHHVDHYHALRGAGFCGLHVPWNLCVLPAKENLRKSARLPEKDAHLAWERLT